MLLAPNEFLHPSFGKYLFAACDILAGIIIHNLLSTLIIPWTGGSRPGDTKVSTHTEGAVPQQKRWADKATLLAAIHLFNPMVFAISTRGSSESVLSLFVLCTLYFSLQDRWDFAAIFLGLSTHWKIYPFVYGVACLSVIGSRTPRTSSLRWLINAKTARFAVISAGTFSLLGFTMYAMYVPVSMLLMYMADWKVQMGIPLCLRVVSIPPPPERPPTQLLTVLLPHLPYVPFQRRVE